MTLKETWTRLGDKPAQIFATTGNTLSYAALEARSRGLAARLWAATSGKDEHVAILMENHPRWLEIAWGALRAGCHVSGINWHLPNDQALAVAKQANSRFLFASSSLADTAILIRNALPALQITGAVGQNIDGFQPYEQLVGAVPQDALADVAHYGEFMFFSSGSTGTPKGIKRALSQPTSQDGYSFGALVRAVNGMDADSIAYSAPPLYHLGPCGFLLGAQSLGATVVLADQFDAEAMLSHIERYRVTHLNLVPTMMIRLMKLPEDLRGRYDISSLRVIFHGAGPCPIAVKRAMIDWLGPILVEGYGGSEMIGSTRIGSIEWLKRPGSVGKWASGGYPVILDDEGMGLPAGKVGRICFADAPKFVLQGEGAAAPFLGPNGEQTYGDLGWMDAEGYLHITDRSDFVINSGGVKVMPQDVEAHIVAHPAVADVVVVGARHPDLGQVPVAIVELAPGHKGSPELADALRLHCRDKLMRAACPRDIYFMPSLPRAPTGKLYAKPLRDAFQTEDLVSALLALGIVLSPDPEIQTSEGVRR